MIYKDKNCDVKIKKLYTGMNDYKSFKFYKYNTYVIQYIYAYGEI
jgi:hypothetical protein